MGEKTEQKENETASPQNIKSKLNVFSEIVLDCFQNAFVPNHSRFIHVCIFQRQGHMAEQTKAPLTELHQSVSWFESKFCYSLSFREFQKSGILTHYS